MIDPHLASRKNDEGPVGHGARSETSSDGAGNETSPPRELRELPSASEAAVNPTTQYNSSDSNVLTTRILLTRK